MKTRRPEEKERKDLQRERKRGQEFTQETRVPRGAPGRSALGDGQQLRARRRRTPSPRAEIGPGGRFYLRGPETLLFFTAQCKHGGPENPPRVFGRTTWRPFRAFDAEQGRGPHGICSRWGQITGELLQTATARFLLHTGRTVTAIAPRRQNGML